MKQETLEEAAAKHFNEEIFVEGVTIQYALQEAYIAGAKAQTERMWSEEEVLEIVRQYALEEHLITSAKPDIWFEQYKKK